MALFFHGPVPGLHVYVWVFSIAVGIGIHLARLSDRSLPAVVESCAVLVVAIAGFIGITSAAIHLGWSDQMAESIGWAPSPFQSEVAFANLALGAVAAGSLFWRAWLLPAIVGKTIFAWGAAATHIASWVQHGNAAPNNIGPILAWDLLLPMVMIALFLAHRRLGSVGAI